MKKIIYKRQDGGISIIHPVINTHPQKENISEEEAFERAKKDIPKDALEIHFVEEHEIPKDRTDRNKWSIENGKVVVKE